MDALAWWRSVTRRPQVWWVRAMGAGDMRPDPAAWEMYRRRFPHRYLVWNVPRQLWEIWQRDPLLGEVTLVEFVFWWEPDLDLLDAPSEELHAIMRRRRDGYLKKVHRPLTSAFVQERLAQVRVFFGISRREFATRLRAQQRATRDQHLRRSAQRFREFVKAEKRYLPALASGRWDERIPQAPVGVSL